MRRGQKKSEIRTASPTLRSLFEHAHDQKFDNLALAAAVDHCSMSVISWRLGHKAPSILVAEELADALGFRIVLEKKP